jgi:hypothetical protein
MCRLTVTVVPSGGDFASKSVEMLYPLLQHCRVCGELVHAPSGTGEAEDACRSTRTRVGGSACGRASATTATADHKVNGVNNIVYNAVGWPNNETIALYICRLEKCDQASEWWSSLGTIRHNREKVGRKQRFIMI